MGKSPHQWGGPPHGPGAREGGLTAEEMAAWTARRRYFMRRVVGFVTFGALLLVLLLVAVAVLAFFLAGQVGRVRAVQLVQQLLAAERLPGVAG